MNSSTTFPSFRAKTAGMDWTWKLAEMAGFSSTLTLARATAPSVASTTCSRIGPRVRHGPHQGAHRSTTTGTSKDRLRTSSSNVASVTSTMADDDTGTAPRIRSPRDVPGLRAGRGRTRPGSEPSAGSVRGHGSRRRRPCEVDIEGIDRDRVTGWLAATVPGLEPPFAFELIAGGRSNLTYRVTDRAGRAYALRRPPVSHVLPTAHDMRREHTVISALSRPACRCPGPSGCAPTTPSTARRST